MPTRSGRRRRSRARGGAHRAGPAVPRHRGRPAGRRPLSRDATSIGKRMPMVSRTDAAGVGGTGTFEPLAAEQATQPGRAEGRRLDGGRVAGRRPAAGGRRSVRPSRRVRWPRAPAGVERSDIRFDGSVSCLLVVLRHTRACMCVLDRRSRRRWSSPWVTALLGQLGSTSHGPAGQSGDRGSPTTRCSCCWTRAGYDGRGARRRGPDADRRRETALDGLVTDLPPQRRRAASLRGDEDHGCDDTTLVSPIGPLDRPRAAPGHPRLPAPR